MTSFVGIAAIAMMAIYVPRARLADPNSQIQVQTPSIQTQQQTQGANGAALPGPPEVPPSFGMTLPAPPSPPSGADGSKPSVPPVPGTLPASSGLVGNLKAHGFDGHLHNAACRNGTNG